MANERLRGALAGKGLTALACSEHLGIDPKTVERWITRDRVPHRGHRVAAAMLLGVDETYLWPSLLGDPRSAAPGRAELIEFYPARSFVPPSLWSAVLDQATEAVDLLMYAGLFLPEVYDLTRLGDRARAGCYIRILLGDPHGDMVRRRGDEEGFGIGIVHRLLLSLRYFERLQHIAGVEIRLHDTTLYASTFRGDDTVLVNTHMYGFPAGQNPVLHLRRIPGGRVVDQYVASFEKVWSHATVADDISAIIAAFDGR